MRLADLKPDECHPHYRQFLKEIPPVDFLRALDDSQLQLIQCLRRAPTERLDYRYEVGKWTPREIILHLIDTERIFACRALRFARQDDTPIPGFDQNSYIDPSEAVHRSLDSLITEFEAVRGSTRALFENFSEEMLHRRGTASGHPLTTRAAGFIILGHTLHHLRQLKEKYLS